MGARFGLRAGGFTAAVACAFLVACGGGGGGGVPATPTPVPTQQVPPTSVSASGSLSASAQTALTLGAISSGNATVVNEANFIVPIVSSATTGSATMQASLPNGLTAPALRSTKARPGKAASLCSGGVASACTIVPIAYITFSVSSTVTISNSPAVQIAVPTAPSGHAYLLIYVSGQWQEISDSVPSTLMTFPTEGVNPNPFTLTANTPYYFAVVYTSAGAISTPVPSPGNAPTLPPVTGASKGGGWGPYEVATAFDFPVQHGYNGQGETVAIVGDDPPNASDLTAYKNAFQLPITGSYTVVNVSGVTPGGADPNGQGEATLDVETVMGLAPGANIVFYNTQGDLSNAGFLTAETQVANANPDVFSISFGGCEAPAPNNVTGWPDTAQFKILNAAGSAVTVSAGDEGDNCSAGGSTPSTQYQFGVDYPGSDPYVFSVGGTETQSSLTSTAVWNDTNFCSANGIDNSTQCAGGGGVSTYYTPPPYQVGLTGVASSTKRNTPDLAMPAEGVIVYLGGAFEFAGTSWSAPEMAALMAELDEYCGGRPASNPVGEFYSAFNNGVGASNFLDIISGNNEWHKNDVGVTYAAGVGYDNVSGLGVPYGMAMASARCGGTAGHGWMYSRTGGATAQSLHRDSYGEQRDTQLPFASRMSLYRDMGERNASDSTRVVLQMRDTATAGSDEQTVTAALRNAGFSITATFGNHSLIVATAPSSTVAGYFRTAMHDVGTQYGTRYINASAITLPAAIAPYVNGVLADNVQTRHRLSHRMR